jgi:F-type H+-transporting ATPase subunit b
MQFLGTIGIDPKLLIAQIINFAILLVVLNKFLYKPLVSQIEKEEKDLHLAQQEKEEVEESKRIESEKEALQIAEIRKKSQAILSEAAEISQKIKEDAAMKAKLEIAQAMKKAKEQLEQEEKSVRKSVKGMREKEMMQGIVRNLEKNTPEKTKKVIAQAFFQLLLEDIEELQLSKAVLSKKFSTKAILETSHSVSKVETDALQKALVRKNGGREIELSLVKNPNLIGGARLQFAGKIVEESMLSHISS